MGEPCSGRQLSSHVFGFGELGLLGSEGSSTSYECGPRPPGHPDGIPDLHLLRLFTERSFTLSASFPIENIPTVKVPTVQGCDYNGRE